MPLTWLDGLAPRISRQLERADRTDVAASILTLVLLLVFNGLIQSLSGIILAVADGSLLTGLSPVVSAPFPAAGPFFAMFLTAILAFGGGVLAAALAVQVTRGLLVDIHPTPHCLLSSLLLLLLGITAVGLSQAVGAAVHLSWVIAIALPGWIVGLPMGAGTAVRADYGRPIGAGLGLATTAVVLALLLVGRLDSPERRPDPADTTTPILQEKLAIKVPGRAPPSPNTRSETTCHAEAIGEGAYGEGNGWTESEARARAITACRDTSCWITISNCKD